MQELNIINNTQPHVGRFFLYLLRKESVEKLLASLLLLRHIGYNFFFTEIFEVRVKFQNIFM